MSTIYHKPSVISRKIEVSFFMDNRFLDSINTIIVPAVFAQSACASESCAACNICGGGTCNCGGGNCAASDTCGGCASGTACDCDPSCGGAL